MDRETRLLDNQRALAVVARAEAGEELDASRRREINDLYTGLGGLVETEAIGLAGLAQARAEGFAQFFTPPAVGTLVEELLEIPGGATVFDPAIGTGRMLFELQDWVRITGIELEEAACRVCRVCLPKAAIIQDDLINHLVEETFDYVIGNPPFSITLTDTRRRYATTTWEGRILSQYAWLELAVRSVRSGGFVAVVLPRDIFKRAETISFRRWLNARAREVLRVELPADTFVATDWPCVLSILQKQPEDGTLERFDWTLSRLDQTDGLITAWKTWLRKHSDLDVTRYACACVFHDEPIRLAVAGPAVRATHDGSGALPLFINDEVRLLPGERLGLKPNGLVAALALAELKLASPSRYDRKRKEHVNQWEELRRKPFLLHHDELVGWLAAAGVDLYIEDADHRGLLRRRRWLARQQTPIERAAFIGGAWQTVHADDGLATQHRHLFDRWMKRAKGLGLHQVLFPFQLTDVCRAAMKQSVLLSPQQGLGKTREAIALQLLVGFKHGLYVVPSKLIGEWENEFRALDLTVHVIDSLAAARRLDQFNLVAMEALWRIPRDSPHAATAVLPEEKEDDVEEAKRPRRLKHTLAAHLRRRCSYIVVDEAYYIKNPDALRSRAVFHLKARHRIPMTGTPIKGYPQNVLAILNWAFGSGSSRFPAYSYHEEGGVKRFLDTFGTYIYYDREHEETGDKGKKKQIPKINNVTEFYDLVAPLMIRRVKREPDVAAVIKTSDPIIEYVPLTIDGDHRRFYEAWLKAFADWYQARLKEQHLGGTKLGRMEILAKLVYLVQAATIPQSTNLTGATKYIAPYDGGPTSLQAWVILRAKEAVMAGEKVIIFSRFIESLKYLETRLAGYRPTIITGSVSLQRKKRTGKSERQALVEAFRTGDVPILLAGTTCLSEGMNIPEASVGIFCDYDWTPSVMFQALYRMVRPQQKRQVKGYFLTLAGTIMEYMQMLCELKQQAIDEGIDYQENDFDLADVPDIGQYCQAIVEAGGCHVPPKRVMRIKGSDDGPEEDTTHDPTGRGPAAPDALPEAP